MRWTLYRYELPFGEYVWFCSNHLKQIQVCYMFAYKSLPMITHYPTSSILSITKNQWNHLKIVDNGIMSILVFVDEGFVASQCPGCICSYWVTTNTVKQNLPSWTNWTWTWFNNSFNEGAQHFTKQKPGHKNPFKQEQKWTRHESLGLEPGDINPYVGWLTGSWFQVFFMFTPIWRRFPFWLIFFNGVETTK